MIYRVQLSQFSRQWNGLDYMTHIVDEVSIMADKQAYAVINLPLLFTWNASHSCE